MRNFSLPTSPSASRRSGATRRAPSGWASTVFSTASSSWLVAAVNRTRCPRRSPWRINSAVARVRAGPAAASRSAKSGEPIALRTNSRADVSVGPSTCQASASWPTWRAWASPQLLGSGLNRLSSGRWPDSHRYSSRRRAVARRRAGCREGRAARKTVSPLAILVSRAAPSGPGVGRSTSNSGSRRPSIRSARRPGAAWNASAAVVWSVKVLVSPQASRRAWRRASSASSAASNLKTMVSGCSPWGEGGRAPVASALAQAASVCLMVAPEQGVTSQARVSRSASPSAAWRRSAKSAAALSV